MNKGTPLLSWQAVTVLSLVFSIVLGYSLLNTFIGFDYLAGLVQSRGAELAAVITGTDPGDVPVPTNPGGLVTGPGSLIRSDIIISPRFYRPEWVRTAESFGATRVGWTYGGARVVSEAKQKGLSVQCAVPYWPPSTDQRWNSMICLASTGRPADNLFHSSTLVYPDVNSAAWRTYVLGEMRALVDAGCSSFQQDEPTLNVHMTVHYDGCYGEESVAGFRAYLRSHYSESRLRSLGINNIATFDYRTTRLAALAPVFLDYQKLSVQQYHQWLHSEVENYAATRGVTGIVWSANLSGNDATEDNAWIFPYFNFLMSEVGSDNTQPLVNRIQAFSRLSESFTGYTSAVTFPIADITINKHAIASAYALGLVPIIPWDVYTGPTSPRLFGTQADFKNSYALVKLHPELFTEYENENSYYGTFPDSVFLTSSVTSEDNKAGKVDQVTVQSLGGTVVDSVDTTSYPDRIAVLWSGRYTMRTVDRGADVYVAGVHYTTVANSTAGIVYLPKTATVAVGDAMSVGTQTRPATRLAITWSGSSKMRVIPKGQEVFVGNIRYVTVSSSTVGIVYLPGDARVSVGDSVRVGTETVVRTTSPYLVSVRSRTANTPQKSVHVISWTGTDVPITVHLRRTDFTVPPATLLTVAHPEQAVSIRPEIDGEYLKYSLPASGGWAVLY